MTAREVVCEVIEDHHLYRNTAGEVTISGGEPLAQHEFCLEVLGACKEEGMRTAVETNLAWPWELVESILPFLDLLIFDIKFLDRAAHEHWTGAGNGRILENVRRLASTGKPLVARTPLVAGVNDLPEEIGRIADLLRLLPNLLYFQLVPYFSHPGKYESIGAENTASGFCAPEPWQIRALAAEARRRGVSVRSPTDVPA